jgi:hypothetical protein
MESARFRDEKIIMQLRYVDGGVGIPKFRAIGKTDGTCFINKSAREKQHPIL